MSTATKTLPATLLFGLVLTTCVAEQSYDEQFFSLFETNHAEWLTNKVGTAYTVSLGMSMAEVVSRVGKPFSVCPGIHEGTWFSYPTNGVLFFKNGKLQHINTYVARGLTEISVKPQPKEFASDVRDYYERFTSLIDTNNSNPGLPDSQIPFTELRNGELFGVRLGMTLAEAVAVWGKPIQFTGSANGTTFWFGLGKPSLRFRNGRLEVIWLRGSHLRALNFDNGLTGTVNVTDLRKLLPDYTEGRDDGFIEMETDGKILELDFSVFNESGNLVSMNQGFLDGVKLRYKTPLVSGK